MLLRGSLTNFGIIFIIGPTFLEFEHNKMLHEQKAFCSCNFFRLAFSFFYILIYIINTHIYKEYNCLSFYARIKPKTVLESLKDSLQTYDTFFNFFFSFSIEMIIRWLTELFQFPI